MIAVTSVAANLFTIAAGPVVFEEPLPGHHARHHRPLRRLRARDRRRGPHPRSGSRRRGARHRPRGRGRPAGVARPPRRDHRRVPARLIPIAALATALLCAAPASAAERIESGDATATVTADPWTVEFEQAGGPPLVSERGLEVLAGGGDGAARCARLRSAATAKRSSPRWSSREAGRPRSAWSPPARAPSRSRSPPRGPRRRRPPASPPIPASASTDSASAPTTSSAAATRPRTTCPTARSAPKTASSPGRSSPPWATRDRDDSTYFPVPWMLSSRGWGVLIDEDVTSRLRPAVDDPGSWAAEADGASLRLRIFSGPTPADALGRFTAATGRQAGPQGALDIRALVPDGSAERDPARRRARDHRRRSATPGSRSRSARPRCTISPAARTRRGSTPSASATPTSTRPGSRGSCTSTPPSASATARSTTPPRPPASCSPRPARCLSTTRRSSAAPGRWASPRSRSPSSTGPTRRPRTSTPSLVDEAVGLGADGWMEDFGEGTPTTGVVLADGTTRGCRAQPLPHRLPLRDAADRFAIRPAAGALPALWLDRQRPLRRGRLGRRPDHGLGLRRPQLGGHPGALDRALRCRPLGHRHRRLRLLRRRASRNRERPRTKRSATSSSPAGSSSARSCR